MYDIIIIGAGPAGLTAAIYGRRANKKVLVLEALTYGGQIITASVVDNYPMVEHTTGVDWATKTYEQAKNLGAEFIFEKAIDIEEHNTYKVVKTPKNSYEGKTVIIATGAENRKLGLPNEDELVGRGVSYCATCDGMFYRGKDVAVIGGGNTALEAVLYLSTIANKVYLIHRRDDFKCDETLLTDAKKRSNVEIILNTSVSKLNANEVLESIDVTDNDKNTWNIPVSAVFVSVGRVPENQNFAKLINLNEAGYVEAGEDCHTNVPGIFVAGDNRVKTVRQLVTAASDGAIATSEAIKYINKEKDQKVVIKF